MIIPSDHLDAAQSETSTFQVEEQKTSDPKIMARQKNTKSLTTKPKTVKISLRKAKNVSHT